MTVARSPEVRAADALRSAATDLRHFESKAYKGIAAVYARGERISHAESSLARWPDGKFRLINSGGLLWKGNDASFTRAELDAAGYTELENFHREIEAEFREPIFREFDARAGILLIQPDRMFIKHMSRSREYLKALAHFARKLSDLLYSRCGHERR